MPLEHDVLVAQQFGSTAEAYLTSAAHAGGEDLRLLAERVATKPDARVIDVGCGAGHASFAVAPSASEVVAYDLTAEMLDIVRRTAAERGLANVTTAQGFAEELPFAGGHFDWAISRTSAHHWHNVPAALKEMRRVLKPGGRVLMIDTAGPEKPLLDTYLEAVELLRDPSHVRNYNRREWMAMFEAAGFIASVEGQWPLALDFEAWITRMRTPATRAEAILSLWQVAPDEVRDHFNVQPDGSFTIQKIMIEAHL